MVMHGGSGDKMIDLPAKIYDNGRPTFHVMGDGTWQMADMMSWHWPVQLMLTQLIMDGVFERHPSLRCAVVELRANWVPAFMEQLDQMHYWAYSNPLYPNEYRLPMRASDYVRRQVLSLIHI